MTHCCTSAVSFDCAVSPCRHRPLENKAVIQPLPVCGDVRKQISSNLCSCTCIADLATGAYCWSLHHFLGLF